MIVRSARSLAGARYAALGVPDDHGSFAEFVVDGISARQQKEIGPLPRHHGMLGVLLRGGEPLRLADIRADPRFEGWPSAHPDLVDVLGARSRTAGRCWASSSPPASASRAASPSGTSSCSGCSPRAPRIALTNARLYERGRKLSVLEERARLARDLHDAVSQKLFSVRVKASAAAVLVDRDPDRAVAEIRSVAALAGEAHAELRAVIDGLARPTWPPTGWPRRSARSPAWRAGPTAPTCRSGRAACRRWRAARGRRVTEWPRKPCTTHCAIPGPATCGSA